MKATNEKRALVCINVYGLSKVNMLIDNAGLGVYHTGVQVYDHEWAFGGHPYSISGIFTMVKPRDLKSLTNIDGLYDFKQCIRIGHTTLSYRNILLLVSNLVLLFEEKLKQLSICSWTNWATTIWATRITCCTTIVITFPMICVRGCANEGFQSGSIEQR